MAETYLAMAGPAHGAMSGRGTTRSCIQKRCGGYPCSWQALATWFANSARSDQGAGHRFIAFVIHMFSYASSDQGAVQRQRQPIFFLLQGVGYCLAGGRDADPGHWQCLSIKSIQQASIRSQPLVVEIDMSTSTNAGVSYRIILLTRYFWNSFATWKKRVHGNAFQKCVVNMGGVTVTPPIFNPLFGNALTWTLFKAL